MNNVLDYIEKFKWAILGTILVHIGIFVYLQLKTVPVPYRFVEDVVQSAIEEEVPLDDYEIEEKILDENGNVVNAISDMNDTRKASMDNFSYSKADQDAMSKTLSYEDQIKRELEANHKPDEDPVTTDDKNGVDVGKQNDNAPTKTSENKASKAIVSFELAGRKKHSLPVPGYMCVGSGTVVIKIRVDKNGKIVEANPIPSLSAGASTCMLQQASKYARRSRFDYKAGAKVQEGKIIYKFIAQ